MKHYQKIYLLLFLFFSGTAEIISAQGDSCDSALPVVPSTGNMLDVSFDGKQYLWLTINSGTSDVELEITPDAFSEFANIESIDLYSGNDCASKTLRWSQNYADTDSLQISQTIRFRLQEQNLNYFLKINRLPGYGDGFKIIIDAPESMGGCTPVCPNIINNANFSTLNAGCLNNANSHQCPDPFNLGCICAWGSSHGSPHYAPGGYPSIGVNQGEGEGIFQNLSANVVAGRNYFLSFDYRSLSPGNNYNLNVELGNSGFNAGTCFDWLPAPDWPIPNTPVGPANNWTTITRCFSPGANYSTIRFYPTSTSLITQWVGVDNVILFELDTPIPDQTITCNEMAILSQPCWSVDPRVHYEWNTGQTGGMIVVYPTVTTHYTLTVSVVDQGVTICSYDIPATVYVNPLPTPVLSMGSTTICGINTSDTWCFGSVGAMQYNFATIPPNPMNAWGPCVDITWNNLQSSCGTIEVMAIANACTSSASFDICLKCQGNPASLTFCDVSASDILNDPQFASYITGGNIFKVPAGQWATFHGTFTIDVPFVIDNSDIRFGPEAEVVVNPSQVFEVVNHSHLHSCDGINMWRSITTKDPTALVYIHDGNNLIEDAECAIRSENGGNFQVNSTTFKNNIIGIGAFFYQGSHPGKVYGSTFTATGTLLNPSFNWCSGYPQCGIRIDDVKQIQIGEPANYNNYGRNIFSNMLSGIYCSVSNVNIYTSEFHDMFDPPMNCSPSEGCGIYAYGNIGRSTEVRIGDQAPSEKCIFNSCVYGIRERLEVHGEIKYNTFTNCENAIANSFCSRHNNIVRGNVIDNFKRGIYFLNAINNLQYGLEIDENLFNTNMTSYNFLTYGKEAINVTNTYSAATNLWVTGNTINYTKVGILARNIWEPCNIRSNTINFDILPADAMIMGVHHGIQCENDNGLQVDNNYIRWRNQPVLPIGFINKMNGISVNYSSSTNIIGGGIFENKIGPYPAVNTGTTYGMGSGINLSSDCRGLILYCNKMGRCEQGLTLNQVNLGPQGYQDHLSNWYSYGNTFRYTPANGGIYKIGGSIINLIEWAYVNADESPIPFQLLIVNPILTPFSSYNCMPPAPMADEEREDIYGMLVSDDAVTLNPDYSGYEEQIKYAASEKFYASVKSDPSLLDAGVAEDAAYVELYDDLANSNIGKIQEIKTSFDSLAYPEAMQKLSLLADSNISELNKKIVMGVFLETLANDIELDSAHRALLEPISLLHPLMGGEGVFWACAMLDKPVNNFLPPLRKANPGLMHGYNEYLQVFPNPVRDELQVRYNSEVSLTLIITDITGKILLSKTLDSKNESERVNTSSLEPGTYIVKLMNASEVISSGKFVIVR